MGEDYHLLGTINSMKEQATYELSECPVSFCTNIIGGKWKPIIIFLIRKGANRFGMLLKGIAGINKQMLTKQLRELERDGVLSRTIFPEIPPRVEYAFTEFGESLFPIIDAMSDWGLERMKEVSEEKQS